MVIIRCNAGPQTGFGHLVRCRALAMALKKEGVDCILAGPDISFQTEKDTEIFSEWIPSQAWKSAAEDAGWLADQAIKRKAGYLVLDDYRVDEEYQKVLEGHSLKWLQFEARTDIRIRAELVLNPSPAADASDYAQALHNPHTELLLGPKYAILRPEFVTSAPQPRNRLAREVLVTFGGGNDRGAILFVLSTLLPHTPGHVRFVVVSGSANPNNEKIARWIKEHGRNRAVLNINPGSLADIFFSCDFAVLAGGTTLYEAACCGLPMLITAIADNQVKQSRAFEEKNAACFLGRLEDLTREKLLHNFLRLMESQERRTSMGLAARSMVDGLGGQRTAQKIMQKAG